MGQEYYRRRLKANKMKRLIASRRSAIRNFRVLLRLILIILIILFMVKVLNMRGWYLNQDLLSVADPRVIKIEGNIITPKYKIVDLIRQVQLPDVQIFKLDTTEMEEKISKLQPVKKVYIRRLWLPARIHVIVEERTPVFLITPSIDAIPTCAITTDGVLIDREYMPLSTKFKTYKILTYGIGADNYEKWNKERVREIIRLTKAFETYSGQNIEYIDMRNPNDVYIKLEKVLIRFGEINDTALKRAKWIATILPETEKIKQKIKYIDLRWEDAHYIKLDEAVPQTQPDEDKAKEQEENPEQNEEINQNNF